MNHFSISSKTLLTWLAVWRCPSIGPQTFFKLVTYLGELEKIHQTPSADLAKVGLTPRQISHLRFLDWQGAEDDLTWSEDEDHHLIFWFDKHYPLMLKHIYSPPPLLFVIGDINCLSLSQLAIVGSRTPTCLGIENAKNFAYELASSHIGVTSGLAKGIDTAAHLGALKATFGFTVAVLGTGLDYIYPKSNLSLVEKIKEKGAVISEFPLGVPPQAQNFPRRNRLISGLSQGLLVVEASLKSGSLITARLAAEQGREVFVLPGSIHNPLAKGCHALIRQGATLVETVLDIAQQLNWVFQPIKDKPGTPELSPLNSDLASEVLASPYQKLVQCIDDTPTTMDVIISRSGLDAITVAPLLSYLEVKGYIGMVANGYYRLRLN